MPRAGWAAVGASIAALIQDALGPGATLVGIALAVAVTTAWVAARGRGRVGRSEATVLALIAGSSLIAVRLALGPPLPPSPLETTSVEGPWAGVVTTVLAPLDGRQRFTLRLDDARLVAVTSPAYPRLRVTDRARIEGPLEEPPVGPYGDYLRRIGVGGTVRTRSLERLGSDEGPLAVVEVVRAGADAALARVLPEPEAGLASGILVGRRDRVDRDLAADFTTAGVSHVVAISGWNIAVVAAAVGAPLRRLSRGRRAVAILLVIAVYTLVAGASPSVVRAALMAAVALTARELGHPGRAAAFLGLATLLMLLLDPSVVSDAGFQLSVAATAGLLVWARPIEDRLATVRWLRVPGWLREALALSLAAQLATLPIVLASFGRLSLVAPLANLAVAPLVPPVMAASLGALVGGFVGAVGLGDAPAGILAAPGWALLATLIGCVRTLAGVPLASVDLEPPLDVVAGGIAAVAALVALPSAAGRLRGVWHLLPVRPRAAGGRRDTGNGGLGPGNSPRNGRTGRWGRGMAVALAGCLVVGVVGTTALARGNDGRVRIVALDVGQGDAILVEGDRGGRLLVDGGPDPERLIVALDARVAPWDRRLDVVMVSHPHEDHVGGLPLLLERYRVGRILGNGMAGQGPADRALRDLLARHGRAVERVGTGDVIRLDSIVLRVIWPDPGTVPDVAPDDGSAVNDRSVVLLGTVGPARFLLTGDAEEGVDPDLVARGLPHVDLLKVAHHGSRTATTAAFLQATRPRIALISVGADNTYGHPAPETLERLDAVGAMTYRTDLDGTVAVAFDGRAWTVDAEHDRHAAEARQSPPPRLGYHRDDVRPEPRRGRGPPPLVRSPALVPAALARGRRDRGLARRTSERGRPSGGPLGGRGRRAPARHRQAARPVGPGPPPAPRRRLRRMARRRGPSGAGPRGRRPSGGPARPRERRRGMARPGDTRGADRRLRRQASRATARTRRCPVRLVGATISAPPTHVPVHPGGTSRRGMGPGHARARPGARRPARARRLLDRRDPPGARPATRLDRGRAPGRSDGSWTGRPGPTLVSQRSTRESAPGPALGYFRGDDGYELERSADRLAARLEAVSGLAPERRRVDGAATTASRIAEWVATAPLFGGGTLVVVVEPGPLIRSAADRTALVAVIAGLAPGNGLVFLDPTDGSARRTAATDALRDAVAEAGGETAEHKAPSEGRLAAWIEMRATERGIALAPGAAKVLGERVGGFVREGDIDRRRMGITAVNELEKLAIYRDGEPVRPEDVEALVAEAVPTSTWAFLDAIGERRVAIAVGGLDRLLATTAEPLLLALLHRRLRELLEVGDRLASGLSLQAVARELKLKPFRAERLAAQARRWRLPELDAAIIGLADLDARVKGVPPATAAQRRAAFVLWLTDLVGAAPGTGGAARAAIRGGD
ncbi:MAG TPA: DNA polymerase III subunit delta [Candidatus Limnocylindrales bacterium]|nr:DNA polymerase III subunit delta [Candidatus Limnocylindrales bacterium]